ncbi:MAG: EVE domain-containing protein [Planctomycetota bacterium]
MPSPRPSAATSPTVAPKAPPAKPVRAKPVAPRAAAAPRAAPKPADGTPEGPAADAGPRRFLVKTEPSELSYATIAKDRRVTWDGVRNALAQRHLASMRRGDLVLVYHTGDEKAVTGLTRVASAPKPDATDPSGKALAVDLVPVAAAATPVPLAAIKADARCADLALVRIPRLSVMPVPDAAWQALVAAAGFPAAP